MADIAMFMAEEYERRVKKIKKSGEEIEMQSCFGVLMDSMKGSSSWCWMREKMRMEREKMVEVLSIGESQITISATSGLFSA